jgi:hypothetical protein
VSQNSFAHLLDNAALLICLGLFYDVLIAARPSGKNRWIQVLEGCLAGGTGVALMLSPWSFAPGIFFDARSVLLCVTGFFSGALPVLTAVLITGGFRMYTGGSGAVAGIAVIVTSGLTGLAWRRWRDLDPATVSLQEMYALGVTVHLFMLGWMLALPGSLGRDVLGRIAVPVLLIFPAATAGLGWLMRGRHSARVTRDALARSEENYRSLFEHAVEGI